MKFDQNTSVTNTTLNEEGLPDDFTLEDWEITKRKRGSRVQYEVRHSKPTETLDTLPPKTAKYLGALYYGQVNEAEGWVSMEQLAEFVSEAGENINPEKPAHNTQLQKLRSVFYGMVECKQRNMNPDNLTRYRLKGSIVVSEKNVASENTYTPQPQIETVENNEGKRKDEVLGTQADINDNLKWHWPIGISVVSVISLIAIYLWYNTFISKQPDIEVPFEYAMRYLLGDEDKEYIFESGQVLRSGDSFRLSIRPESAAYVYVFYKDTADASNLLFPPANTINIPQSYQNPVDAEHTLHLPSPTSAYRLDNNEGYESIVIIAVRDPIDEFDFMRKQTVKSENTDMAMPSMPAALNKADLNKALRTVRKRFAETCPTCIRTIDIIHR